MKLLKNSYERRKWLHDAGEKPGEHQLPDRYPCLAYLVIRSFDYEQQEPRYLYSEDLRAMLRTLDDNE